MFHNIIEVQDDMKPKKKIQSDSHTRKSERHNGILTLNKINLNNACIHIEGYCHWD